MRIVFCVTDSDGIVWAIFQEMTKANEYMNRVSKIHTHLNFRVDPRTLY